MNLSLFDQPSGFDRAGLGRRLRELARENIWIGTSSWKYEGWLDQIYTRERYLTRGKFSQKLFEAECVKEFAETFPTVCGDFSFHQVPSPGFWAKLFTNAPAELKFALKVPEEFTAEVFPGHPRYGLRAGQKNPMYLDADVLRSTFLQPLEPYRERIGPLIFEFGARGTPAREFFGTMDEFLEQLPPTFRYAVEVRNPGYLSPHYFAMLSEHRTAHVFNAWSKMPLLSEQMAMEGSVTTDFTVVRALLRQGRVYEEAVKTFARYDRVQDENTEGRDALRKVIERMREERKGAFVYVNNRFEGNSPLTIKAVVE